MDFLGTGPWEILLILVIALLLLGPGKIVEFSRTLGKWSRAIKRAGSDFTTAVTREVEKIEQAPPANAETKTPTQPASGGQGSGAAPGEGEAPPENDRR